MPQNVQTPDCLHTVGGAQLFMSPTWTPDQKGVKVQIVDVFALRLATGYEKDPTGRLLLQSEESVAQGRTWSLAKACQLVRNDAQPSRWVVLHRHKRAWGLFWAGGGLDLCRDELTKQNSSENTIAIVPSTPQALLRLLLELESPESEREGKPKKIKSKAGEQSRSYIPKVVTLAVITTSVFWLAVLFLLAHHFNDGQKKVEKRLDNLIELTKKTKE